MTFLIPLAHQTRMSSINPDNMSLTLTCYQGERLCQAMNILWLFKRRYIEHFKFLCLNTTITLIGFDFWNTAAAYGCEYSMHTIIIIL